MRAFPVAALLLLAAAPAGADECGKKVDALRKKLESLKTAAILDLTPDGQQPAQSPMGRPIDVVAPVIRMRGGVDVHTLGAAKRAYVDAPATASVARLAEALGKLDPEIEVRLLIVHLNRSQASEKASKFAEEMTRALGTCEALRDAFGSAGGYRPEEKWPFLKKSIPAAVATCRCKGLDLSALESSLVAITKPENEVLHWLPLTLRPTGKSLGLGSAATIQELVDALQKVPAADRAGPLKP